MSHDLIWVDLEMTGLDLAKNRIIEIATIITDSDLKILSVGPNLAIWQSDALLETMDSWNTKQHNLSGLVTRVRNSTISEQEAELQTLQFLKHWVDNADSPMCGNSVHQDRKFLQKYMPTLERFFHYRNLDVSTLKELAKRWQPKLIEKFKKESRHLALDDVKDSIAELEYYRDNFIRNKTT